MTNPPPRPALRKAPDSDIHPLAGSRVGVTATSLKPVVGLGGPADTKAPSKPKKVKRVALDAKVAPDLRKSVRKAAKARGISVDDLVADALESYLAR